MSLEIFKNADNNILFTGGGNVLKRPYEFGNSINVGMTGITSYVSVGNLNLLPGFTLISFVNLGFLGNDSYNNSALWQHFSYVNSNNDEYKFGYNTLGSGYTRFSINGTNVLSEYGAFPPYSNWFMHAFSFDEGGVLNYREFYRNKSGDKNFNTTYSNYASSYKINEFRIGGNQIHPSTRYGQFSIFNRALSNEELSFKLNNRLGNEFLSKEGMVLDLKCNSAEILDFSIPQDGTDLRIGVRDYSGNFHHGQIMNLPAVTLQEQLDYANANLFKQFI